MKIHFIGCNGVSMNMLMKLAKALGHTVTGSDLALGGHDPNFVEGCDLVVFTGAIHSDNPELVRAKNLNIRCIERAEYLGEISRMYQHVIAVSGAHGKTTVTGLLYYIMRSLHPTLHIGGEMDGNRGVIDGSEFFISEACEYRRSFLSLAPDIGIILNIALDHTDYYKDYDDILSAFQSFADNSKKLIIYGDKDYGICHGQKLTFGLKDFNDVCAKSFYNTDEGTKITVTHKGVAMGEFLSPLRGEHNVCNVLAAVAAGAEQGLGAEELRRGIAEFKGVSRRMEYLGRYQGTPFYSDYAHHPDEIRAALCAVRFMNFIRPLVIFEPHTYTRTKSFLYEFADAFKDVSLALLPVYAAREDDVYGVSSSLLAEKINAFGGNAGLVNQESLLCLDYARYDAVIFMGAGSVDSFARSTLKTLSKKG